MNSGIIIVIITKYLQPSCPSVLWCCWLGNRKNIQPVKSTTMAVFLVHHDSMVAECCLHVRNTVIVTEALMTIVAVSLTYFGSMVTACCPQWGTLSSFTALMLLVGWQEGHMAPLYLMDSCTPTAEVAGRQHLRSASQQKLIVPRYRPNSFGRRCFAVAGPSTWNWLPDSLRDPALSLNIFRRQLKTTFFAKYWRDVLSALEIFLRMRYRNSPLLTYIWTVKTSCFKTPIWESRGNQWTWVFLENGH